MGLIGQPALDRDICHAHIRDAQEVARSRYALDHQIAMWRHTEALFERATEVRRTQSEVCRHRLDCKRAAQLFLDVYLYFFYAPLREPSREDPGRDLALGSYPHGNDPV
jgi:hypothetical protein